MVGRVELHDVNGYWDDLAGREGSCGGRIGVLHALAEVQIAVWGVGRLGL